jgi:hypothetical protein
MDAALRLVIVDCILFRASVSAAAEPRFRSSRISSLSTFGVNGARTLSFNLDTGLETTILDFPFASFGLTVLRSTAWDRRGPHSIVSMETSFDRFDYFRWLYDRGVSGGFIPAMKAIRGAYMEAERACAAERGQRTRSSRTCAAFDAAVRFCIEHRPHRAPRRHPQ